MQPTLYRNTVVRSALHACFIDVLSGIHSMLKIAKDDKGERIMQDNNIKNHFFNENGT